MKERARPPRRWRVGELARATGLTVRTLHHYEHVGLVVPGGRTGGRHRVYDAEDVRRLYKVCALRDLGLSLPEIRRVLDDDPSLGDVLRAHAARVDAEIARLGRLRTLLRHACAQADRVDAADVLATIDAMVRVARRADLRAEEGGAPDDVEARWRALGAALSACMEAGEPASSARVRALARKAAAYLSEFAGGEEALLDALAHLRRAAPPEDLAGWTPALLRYLDKALAGLAHEEEQTCGRNGSRGTSAPTSSRSPGTSAAIGRIRQRS